MKEQAFSPNVHLITRRIEIDMGHRVTHHGSKCRNLHGHRYVIEATCSGPLAALGEEQGMVLDFGFLKEEMVEHIDKPCDHGFCLWAADELLMSMFATNQDAWPIAVKLDLEAQGWSWCHGRGDVKLYIVKFVPTAENLARHWFERLEHPVRNRSEGRATLRQVKVWETPNCSAQYPNR